MDSTPKHHEAASGLQDDFLLKSACRKKQVYSIAEEEDLASLCSRLAIVEENLVTLQTLSMPSINKRINDVSESLDDLGHVLVKYQHEVAVKVHREYLGLKEQMQQQDDKIEGELHQLEQKVAQSLRDIAWCIDAEGDVCRHLFNDQKQSSHQGGSATSKASTSVDDANALSATSKASTSVDDAVNATDLDSNMELKSILDATCKCISEVHNDLAVQAQVAEKFIMSLETAIGAQTQGVEDGFPVCPVTNNTSAEVKPSPMRGLLQQVYLIPKISVPQLPGGGSIQRQTSPQRPEQQSPQRPRQQSPQRSPQQSPQRSPQQSPMSTYREFDTPLQNVGNDFNSAVPLPSGSETLIKLQHASLQAPVHRMSAGIDGTASPTVPVLRRACIDPTDNRRGSPWSMRACALPRKNAVSPVATRPTQDSSWMTPKDCGVSSSSPPIRLRSLGTADSQVFALAAPLPDASLKQPMHVQNYGHALSYDI